MAKPVLISTITTLSKRIDALLETQKKLMEKVKSLEADNIELKARHEKDMAELDKAKKDIEFLSLSHRLANSPEALVAARNKISQLIRTVDSCIRMIKED